MMLAVAARRAAGVGAAAKRTAAVFGVRAMSSADGPYDVVVIGAGPGGYVGAIKAAQLGLKTVCIEGRGRLGGTCLNVGCIPSKALLESTHHYHAMMHDFEKHGLIVEKASFDLTKMMSNKSKVVEDLTNGIEGLFKKNKVDYVKGWGKIIGANQVSVELTDGGNKTIEAKNIVIATGSEPAPLPPCPVDNAKKRIVDSTGVLELEEVPKHLVVVGGGVIGLEMASVWSRLGSKVTVVEYADSLCPGMDKEVVTTMQRLFKKQGMDFKLKTKVVATEVSDSGVKVTMEPSAGGSPQTLDADVVLVATGRRAYTQGLGLDKMGIPTDKMGRVEVDEHFRTNIPNIWAIGDVIRGPMLAHKGEEEGIACMNNIAGKGSHINYNAIPGVIYTHPEVASVGFTEEDLKAKGIEYNKGKFFMAANSRARAVGQTDGFVKILSDKATDRILGAHIISSNAGEMIAEAVIGIEYGASSEDMAHVCHPHPCLSEAFKEAAMATYDKPINS